MRAPRLAVRAWGQNLGHCPDLSVPWEKNGTISRSQAFCPRVLRLLVAVLSLAALSLAGSSVRGDDSSQPPAQSPQPARVVFITAKDCPRCDEELARLNRAGGDFEKLRAAGWKIGAGEENHLQIVDREAIAELVEKLEVREFPTVAAIDGGQIVRSFRSGCTTPLDRWTFGFLAKGVDERPPGSVSEAARVETTGHYRLRGNHWSVEEDWNPAKPKVVSHLRGPNHGHQILSNWKIEEWSYEELRSLHDDLHEREMSSSGSYSSRGSSTNTFSAARKAGGH